MSKQIGVLYDLDGTLIDTYNLILTSCKKTTQEVLGKVFPDEVNMKNCGQPLEVCMGAFTDNEKTIKVLCERYRVHMPALHDDLATEFPGIKEMLSDINNAGIPQAVVTSKLEVYAKRGLDLLGISQYFECLVTPEDTKIHKPNPDPVLLGIKKLGLKPKNCYYVGDSPYDICAGNAAGCTTIAVSWGKVFSREQHEEQSPDYIVNQPSEVADIVLEK